MKTRINTALLFIIVIGLIWPSIVYAQNLNIRASESKEYTRLVFDWGQNIAYTVTQTDKNKLTVSFPKKPTPLPDFSLLSDTNAIEKVTYKGSEQNKLVLEMTLSQNADVRDFRIGSRILIDVFIANDTPRTQPKTVTPKEQPKPKSESVKQEVQVEKPPVVVPKEEKVVEPELPDPKEQVTASKVEEVDEEELSTVSQYDRKIDLIEEHLVSVSSTTNFNMAAFKRHGYLWLVTDELGRNLSPQIRGKQSHLMKPIKTIRAANGVAYLIPITAFKKVFVEPEGGGLLWRFILKDTKTDLESSSIQRAVTNVSNEHVLRSNMSEVGSVMSFKDPVVGDTVRVVTVGRSNNRIQNESTFVDLNIESAYVGALIAPKSDNVYVRSLGEEGFEIGKEGFGLSLANQKDYGTASDQEEIESSVEANVEKLYFFSRWADNGIKNLDENRRAMELSISQSDEGTNAQDFLRLAKLYLANKKPQEALGYLERVSKDSPDIENTNPFKILRGAAYALAGRATEAIKDMQIFELENQQEFRLWKSLAYAAGEDWEKAYRYIPESSALLFDYPRPLRHKVALVMAETALRYGDLKRVFNYLKHIERDLKEANKYDKAAYHFLEGELRRQEGATEEAIEIWTKLAKGSDRLHRAKAGLSLVKLELENEKITGTYALEELDRIRYVWRGDGLETQINYTLGLLYIQKGDFRRGLELLKDTATLAISDRDKKAVAGRMKDIFTSIFTGKFQERVNALEAITIYENFSELLPTGAKGDQIMDVFVQKLIDVDLLGRATNVLEDQIKHRLTGQSKVKAQVKLAKVLLLDQKPRDAMFALNEVSPSVLRINSELNEEVQILRARALSENGDLKRALDVANGLSETDRVLALKANIAWQNADWARAAKFLQSRLAQRDIDIEAEPDESDVQLILNLAITYKLSNNRLALDRLKRQYDDYMTKTKRKNLFKLVSRKPEEVGINDKEEILAFVAEVDLFEDVLDSF